MSTTTIRVNSETHAQLVELSRSTGASLIDTVRDAAEALRRQRIAHTVAAEIAELRTNSDQWDDYLGDAESTTVDDSVG